MNEDGFIARWVHALVRDRRADVVVMGTLFSLTFIVSQLIALFRGNPFEPRAFGIGAGAMLAAYGAAWKLRKPE